jgi:hypothetical protein
MMTRLLLSAHKDITGLERDGSLLGIKLKSDHLLAWVLLIETLEVGLLVPEPCSFFIWATKIWEVRLLQLRLKEA